MSNIVQLELFPSEGETKPQTLAEKTMYLLQSMLKFQLDIEAALSYAKNAHSFDDIVEGVVTGRYHFYPLDNSFVLMELQTYPNHSVYHCFLVGGTLPELFNVHSIMVKNAKKLGAKYCSVVGRKGWERAIKQFGWEHQYSCLYLEVE